MHLVASAAAGPRNRSLGQVDHFCGDIVFNRHSLLVKGVPDLPFRSDPAFTHAQPRILSTDRLETANSETLGSASLAGSIEMSHSIQQCCLGMTRI